MTIAIRRKSLMDGEMTRASAVGSLVLIAVLILTGCAAKGSASDGVPTCKSLIGKPIREVIWMDAATGPPCVAQGAEDGYRCSGCYGHRWKKRWGRRQIPLITFAADNGVYFAARKDGATHFLERQRLPDGDTAMQRRMCQIVVGRTLAKHCGAWWQRPGGLH